MLNVYQSNQMERLVDALTDVIKSPLPSPLMPEWIGVQTQGVGVWLGMRIAQRMGISANIFQPYPRVLIERIFQAVLKEDCPDTTRFEPDSLSWAILALLPELIRHPPFAALASYLSDDPNGLKRFRLAQRVAEVLDRYAVYRPDWVLPWESGKGLESVSPVNRWQPVLWQALVQRFGPAHVAAAAKAYFKVVSKQSGPITELPSRISLFGISTLPPLYLKVLAALPDDIEINLFLFNPSKEYWTFIRSRKETLRALVKEDANADDIDALLHYEEGHPLLSSLGRVGRDFQCILEETVDYIEPAGNLFEDPMAAGKGSRLHQIQSDILHLGADHSDSGLSGGGFSREDTSVSIHSCHSPMREVQVLHDRLLDIFHRNPDIAPHDVIVMMPDISAYRSAILTVFGSDTAGPMIPFSLADSDTVENLPVVQSFMRILHLAEGRLPISEVLDLLSMDPVRECFSFSVEALDHARRWLVESGIRWGEDATHRESFGQPALSENTWRFGLNRFLLGMAMPDSPLRLLYDTLPFPGIEGKDTECLGNLIHFCETLFEVLRPFKTAMTVSKWQHHFFEVFSRLLAITSENASQQRIILDAMADIVRNAEESGFNDPVPLAVIQEAIKQRFNGRPSIKNFLSGGVTFCNLLPMRSIPFKVVCLLGMNDQDYPRKSPPAGFDLTGQHPRPGDRSVRNDDRYLFLEALLAARDYFLVFYVGQAIRDNSISPPSVVVGELIDVNPQLVTTRHPLQPFHPAYFHEGTSALFSYSNAYLEGARALISVDKDSKRFIVPPLGSADDSAIETVSLKELIEFFKMPAAYLLRRRLGIRFSKQMEAIEPREPIYLSGLDRFEVGAFILKECREGRSIEDSLASIKAGGRFPLGTLGTLEGELLSIEITSFLDEISRTISGQQLPDLSVETVLGDIRVAGAIDQLWPNARINVVYGSFNEKRKLAHWITHLFLNCSDAKDYPRHSILICKEKGRAECVEFPPIGDRSREFLTDLVTLFCMGQTVPLRFFPVTSYAYARAWFKARETGGDSSAAMVAARGKWRGGQHQPDAEGEKLEIQKIFQGTDPLGALPAQPGLSFSELALKVWAPIIELETQLTVSTGNSAEE